jgi:HEPN domain-containing protein
MSGADPTLIAERKREAARWLAVALVDRRVAETCLAMNPPTFGIAAYHCQQATEKLIKGKLIIAGTHFPKTHDLRALGAMAATHYPQWRDLFVACIEWTSWGHAYRYPSLEEEMEPSAEAIDEALQTIDTLAHHLRSLTDH